MTDADIAQVCAASYDTATKWDVLWPGADSDGIYAGLIGNVLCFRGSVTTEDWFRDLDTLPTNDPALGGIHAGFAAGVGQFFAKNLQLLHQDTIICGHSLGAARALICAGYAEQAGLRPKAVITFGSPRPGFSRLAEILIPVTIRSYQNRNDLVTDVPRWIWPELPYLHPRPPIAINVPPAPGEFGIFADHHIQLYLQGTPSTPIT